MNRANRHARAQGFTLIELLVAIAILALVAVLSWRGLDQILRARETVAAAMEKERALVQFFDQFGLDARAAAADDVIGAPAVRVHQNQSQIARHFDVSGQAPRVQLVRYYRQGQRMIRAASPLLESRAALHSALAEPVSVEAGWSAVTLMRDTLAFNVRIWMPKLGWGDQMSATQRPASPTKDSAAGNSIHPRSVTGIEIQARCAGMRRALTRIALVGEWQPIDEMTSKKRARGAALMTALFVVALAALLVSGLLWRQHVQIRRLENERLMMRALGAAASVDYLGGVWAVPLAPTHLSDVLGRAGDAVRAQAGEDTELSGWVEDAQAKFNLRNLVGASASGQWQPDIVQIKNFQRLLSILKLEPELANAAAAHLRAALAGLHPPEAQTEPNDEAEDANPSTQPLFLDDLAMLLDVPGFSREVIARLAPFVTVLPQRSAVNVNTARAEVIAALFEGLGLANAQTLAEQREQIFFVHTADFVNRARAISGAPLPLNANAQQFDVKTRFLIIHGRIRHGRVQLARDAWVYRDRAARKARIVRVRDAE